MKAFMKIIIPITILLMGLQVSADNDTVFAIVEDNNVTLWDMDAHRNCGSSYVMQVEEENQVITWIQRDTGDYAYCFCSFDYSIHFGPLNPGTYLVNVYYTYPEDTVRNYVGSTSFNIESPLLDSLAFFNPFSSDCGGINLGTKEIIKKKSGLISQNFPNPFSNQTSIHLKMRTPQGELLIYNSMGVIVRKIKLLETTEQEVTISRLDDEGQRLPPGIYFYSIRTPFPTGFHKMIVVD